MTACVHMRWALILIVVLHLAAEVPPSLFERVLAFNQMQEPELDVEGMRGAFARTVQACRDRIGDDADPSRIIAALNRELLGEADRELRYRSNLSWRDATLAAALLRRRGNCLAGAVLYACVGDALSLPIRAVFVPGHALARWDDGSVRINIETTAGGVSPDDELYFRGPQQSDPADRTWYGWGRSLTADALLAELATIAAWHHEGSGDRQRALACLDEAVRLQPERSDRLLSKARIEADQSGDRVAYEQRLQHCLADRAVPSSVHLTALLALAKEAGARREFMEQRNWLLQAWRISPKWSEEAVLTSLAFCHRSLKDWRGAVRYMELALVLIEPSDPGLASHLYNFAILQKNDGDILGALSSIDRAIVINPESWNLQVIKAGYLCLAGRGEEGRRLHAQVQEPRADRAFWCSMKAWFFAVSGQREQFYPAFREALGEPATPHTLIWVDQDVDLDPFRQEPEFQAILAEARARILNTSSTTTP